MGAGPSDLPVVQPKGMPQGTPEYEKKRAVIIQALAAKVPNEFRLPKALIDGPPVDVSKVPASCGLLSLRDIEITENYDAFGLAEGIASKEFTAVEVVTAFAKRAIIAHQLTCCLTQWFMYEAVERAKELDDYLEKNGKTTGPLHGVPISIKEHMPIAKTYSSAGCIESTVFDDKDSHMIAMLRNMGAVFYCKTNQPQAIMHLVGDYVYRINAIQRLTPDLGNYITLWPHPQPLQHQPQRGWLHRWRRRARSYEGFSTRRWNGHRRQHPLSERVLWYLWIQANKLHLAHERFPESPLFSRIEHPDFDRSNVSKSEGHGVFHKPSDQCKAMAS